MLSASYILYYYQDLLGVSAIAMGMILMVALYLIFNDQLWESLLKTRTNGENSVHGF